jgi:hypothetical protein
MEHLTKKLIAADIVKEIEDKVRTKISLRDSVEIIARS